MFWQTTCLILVRKRGWKGTGCNLISVLLGQLFCATEPLGCWENKKSNKHNWQKWQRQKKNVSGCRDPERNLYKYLWARYMEITVLGENEETRFASPAPALFIWFIYKMSTIPSDQLLVFHINSFKDLKLCPEKYGCFLSVMVWLSSYLILLVSGYLGYLSNYLYRITVWFVNPGLELLDFQGTLRCLMLYILRAAKVTLAHHWKLYQLQ